MDERPVAIGQLPLAPWEGAAHRSWPLVAAGALLLMVVAAAVCFWAGVPPGRVLQSSFSTMQSARGFVTTAATALREASLVVQVGFGLLFIAVNTVLVLLLRRAPRGIDA